MKMSMRVAAILALLASAYGNAATAPLIVTAQGSVQGTLSEGVESYRGLPFAKPPLGALRWKSPQPPANWQGVRDASRFSANCYQAPATPFGPYTAEFLIGKDVSEDCLYLNVWTAKGHGKLKPVYLFIHGGGFSSGSGSIPIYDGSNLAAKGVVVVTINYRLGVFGYLAHPELTAESLLKSSGNYGIEDIIAALHWVHDNIRSFGGDPDLVTISGQSAGAVAVNDLLMSVPAKGLFARAVAESGSGMGVKTPTLKEAEQSGLTFAASAHADSLQGLRALSAADLVKFATSPPPGTPRPSSPSGLRFAPNADGVIIKEAPEAGNHPVGAVPLLTGFNNDEGALFGGLVSTRAEFEEVVRKGFSDYADRVLALYPHADDKQAKESAELLSRDKYMASLTLFSKTRSAAGQKVYNYLFDHAYPIPNSAQFKAFHTAEVPYVFGALKQEGRTFGAADHAASAAVQATWIQFMKSGDPNGKGFAAWPEAGEAKGEVMELGDHPGLRLCVSSKERFHRFEEFVNRGHALTRL
jgi:para-nitrobenzyl esterase